MLKAWLREFEKFAMRGNMIDMVVGVIIGAAFTKIVDSLVKDIIMPPLGLILGKMDFTNLFVVLQKGSGEYPYKTLLDAQNAGAITLNFGLFLNAMISFLIVAFTVFLLIKTINKLDEKISRRETAEVDKNTKECPFCCSDIPIKATRCPHCTSRLDNEE